MSKNIVICSDGTGNSAIKGRGTNVFKMFEAIDLNGHKTQPELRPQVALYDDGVGTEAFKPLKIFAGATGFGLSRNVKQLYKELVRVYDPGDRIFLFGFSRGAFTVRTLAGFIAACGMLDADKFRTAGDLESAVRKTYNVYRKSYRTALAKLFLGEPDTSVIKRFRDEHCRPCDVPITFMGVWDTVDAVGLPFHVSDFINMVFYRFKFRDHKLSKLVEHACHALSIDDERHSFHPILWHEGEGDAGRIEQVWFAGAHSNVGGGYPKQGMSLVALEWMMRKAEATGREGDGLRLVASDRALYYDHANVDGKLYDPRAGLGIFYRWKLRDIAAICRMHHVRPAIHLSVVERIAHGTDDYAPGNLPADAKVVITPTGDAEKDGAALQRAKEVELVLRAAHAGEESLLPRVRTERAMGLASYYVYLIACIVVVLAASAPDGVRSFLNPLSVAKNAGLFVADVATLQLGAVFTSMKQLAMSPWLIGFLAGGFLVSYLLMLSADYRMSAVFSQFWHQVQPKLRDALKRARKTARKLPTGDDTRAA
ncbi:MAG: DUF2235 domain-containing protein [Nitrospiraceae bacterium]